MIAARNKSPEKDGSLEKALAHHKAGRLQQAAQIYTILLEDDPRHADALHLLGVIGIQTGNYESAVSLIDQALQVRPDQPFYYSNLGNAYQGAGIYGEALTCYEKALQIDPAFVDAGFNQANTWLLQGDLEKAIIGYRKVIAVNPEFSEAYNNLGKALQDLGDIKAAIACYQQAVDLNPAYADAYNNMGNAHRALGSYAAGIKCYQKAIQLQPGSADAYYNLGNLMQDQGELMQARDCYRKALQLAPQHCDALNNLGKTLQDLGEPEQAVAQYQKALALQPQNAAALYNLANALKDQGHYLQAIDGYQSALKHKPQYVEAHNNLGNVYQKIGRFEDAARSYQLALDYAPEYAAAWNNLGKTLQELVRLEDAKHAYRQALRCNPQNADAHFNHALALLLTGELEQGWQEYEWRFSTGDWQNIYPHRIDLPRWQGQQFSGQKLFVHSEQGLGDTLQFIRYLPWVKAKGGTVIFETMKSLHPLLAGFAGIDQLAEMSAEPNPTAGYDFYVPLLSLPGIFRTTRASIPADVPYIQADNARIAEWRKQLGTAEYKVGLVWAGKPSHKNDHNRSIPLAGLAPLTRIEGVALYGLQKGESGDQVRTLQERIPVRNLGHDLKDFADTAAVVANLDLLISVDTSVAHLAGAMGRPVWTLLPFMPDWRWMLSREDSPWYPTMRLFRQPERGNWEAVIGKVAKELQKLLMTH